MVDEEELHDAALRLVGDRGRQLGLTTMPSEQMTAHAGCGLGMPSTSIRHIRQAATGSSSGWSQNRGTATPSCSAARMIKVPFGTEVVTPSMVSVTRSARLSTDASPLVWIRDDGHQALTPEKTVAATGS